MIHLRSLIWFSLALAITVWALWPNFGAAVTAGKAAPEITAEHWINSKPLTIDSLKGRVVLIEFWTYG
jgi:hypothetical protein